MKFRSNIEEMEKNPFTTFLLGISKVFFFLVFCALIILLLPLLLPSTYNFQSLGSLGDTFGGFVNPVIGIVAALLTFLAFYIQYQANLQVQNQFKIQKFESQYYEMIRLYRNNVNELKYRKFKNEEFLIYENRQVFNVIFKEFIECYSELGKFFRHYEIENIMLEPYAEKLKKTFTDLNRKIDLNQMALIDIAYSIIYFGLSEEGESILRLNFSDKYHPDLYYRLICFIKLKPKKENKNRFFKWERFRKLESPIFHNIIEEIYKNKDKTSKDGKLSDFVNELDIFKKYDKYYGGHQFRLGHYYRHLFQSYKYLESQKIINRIEKYDYGKILRAQLSYYEQALLFINSLSGLGVKWELFSEKEELDNTSKYITNYNLIKNLHGNQLNGIKFKEYYPEVNYENNKEGC